MPDSKVKDVQKTVRILSLKFKNFKDFKKKEIHFNGHNTDIYGFNQMGKTTIFDGVIFLLFGKDSLGKAEFSLKPRDTKGVEASKIEHEVEGVFEISDRPNPVTLTRIYQEKWTTPRGKPEKELTSHTTSYSIDGEPNIPKKKYDEFVEQICPEKTFRILTDPLYFNSLPWKERRDILTQLEEIADEDVISAYPKLADLPKILGDKTPDSYKNIIKDKKKKIEKKKEIIPTRIDERTERINSSDLADVKQADVEIELAEVRKSLNDCHSVKSILLAAGGPAKLKADEIAKLRESLRQLDKDHREACEKNMASLVDKKQEIARENTAIKKEFDKLNKYIIGKKDEFEDANNILDGLKDEWYLINNAEFEGDSDCEHCGAAVEYQNPEFNTIAKFNQKKAEKLEFNQKAGANQVEKIKEIEKKIAESRVVASELLGRVEKNKASLLDLDSKIKKTEEMNNVSELVEHQELVAQISSAEQELVEIKNTDKDHKELKKLEDQISSLETMKEGLDVKLAVVKSLKEDRERIAELKKQDKEYAQKIEQIQRELLLIEKFATERANYISERVNNRFKLVKWQLHEVQVNGGINDQMCECLWNGVPYSTGASYSERVYAGMDIINTLQDHYDFVPFVIIDNAESILRPIDTEAQVVRLVASDLVDKERGINDKKELRIECHE